jgi:hypothetical protein
MSTTDLPTCKYGCGPDILELLYYHHLFYLIDPTILRASTVNNIRNTD